ncbi:MAG TPA: putative baseplate assembly protein, partial [Myxococcales bacterium]|nr:putative baseplate assembly protein [Myxococcales bacterium]
SEVTGWSDGTNNLVQGGKVRFKLPDNVARATVNGLESCWLRVRLVAGNYGQEAHYTGTPAQGYTFVPASFAPPVLSRVLIGYAFTAQRTPEVLLSFNDLDYRDLSGGPSVSSPIFPFLRAADQDRPSLSLGFTLPATRTAFPNATLSLYASVAGAKYGEQPTALGPDVSRLAGDAGGQVEHPFTVLNTSPRTVNVQLLTRGWQWTATPSVAGFSLGPGESAKVQVLVDVPGGAQAGESDRGFLQVTLDAEPGVVHGASFVTGVGAVPAVERPELAWQYWNGQGWVDLTVRDGTQGLARPEVVELLAPRDFAPRRLFGRDQYWLRLRWEEGDLTLWPRLRQLLLNTAPAVHSVTVLNEVLGSSTGAEGQQLRSTRAPVLSGQKLEVREAEIPGAGEADKLRGEEGEDAIPAMIEGATQPKEIWIRWHEVPDFYGSGPRDRHYVMDHLTGEIRFGNGVNGQIPPIGSSNLRLAQYRTGGGRQGNRAEGTVNQLKTTVPYVDKVTNPEAATGGSEPEPLDALYERMPRQIRHRDRAVTVDDYEDLAALASPEVARSSCVPLGDLESDPLGVNTLPGMVSLIVVPRTTDAKPQPSLELLGRVKDYLLARSPAGAGLSVVGPRYVRVDVRTEVGVTSLEGAGAVADAVQAKLAAFLHPLTGGLDGKGWSFGRAPHRSDILSLIEGVEGVDHVVFLQVDETEELEGVRQTGRFLVFSGTHQVDLVFEEP